MGVCTGGLTHWRMLTYADVCWRVLTCADVCWRMLTYADACWRVLTYADVCWGMLTYSDVCWRMLTYADVCWRCESRTWTGAAQAFDECECGRLEGVVRIPHYAYYAYMCPRTTTTCLRTTMYVSSIRWQSLLLNHRMSGCIFKYFSTRPRVF
jgi:hypothetical protein